MANRNSQIRNILEDCRYYDSFVRPEYIGNLRYLLPSNNAGDLCRRVMMADVLHVPQRENDDINNIWTERGRRVSRYDKPQDYTRVESFDHLNINTQSINHFIDITLVIILLIIIYTNAQ